MKLEMALILVFGATLTAWVVPSNVRPIASITAIPVQAQENAPTLTLVPDATNIIQFTLKSCPACKAVRHKVERIAKQGFVVQVVDAAQNPELAKQFGVQAVPAFFIYSPKGEILASGREAREWVENR